ncbi:hypothetical protein [Streptomyces sp. NPDC087270]|uniref:hypothetical protein n=1 Tax=Streptomyces sp. NPDC087270 TaxID=3365774 RepID=UPI003818C6C7
MDEASKKDIVSRVEQAVTQREWAGSPAEAITHQDQSSVDIDRAVNNIGHMVNSDATRAPHQLGAVSVLVGVYAAAMVGTVVALAVMASTAPEKATNEAWGHALIVTFFAVLLLVRLRSARLGSTTAVRALGIIAAAMLVANLVEAALPGAFPGWMRVEMVAIALWMSILLTLLRRSARR